MANPLDQLFPHSLKHVSWHGWKQPNIAAAQRRTERDAQIIVPSAATNMIECLDRDRDAFRQLASFLSLRELGQLAGCSIRIRHWFMYDGLPTLLPDAQVLRDTDLESLAQCAWARRRIAKVQLVYDGQLIIPLPLIGHAKQLLRPMLGIALLSSLPWTTAKLWLHQADRLWALFIRRIARSRSHRFTNSAMLQLPRLEHLKDLCWYVLFGLDALALHVCFRSLGSLQALTIAILPTAYAIETRATIMTCIAGLRSLCSLEIVPFDAPATAHARRLATPYFASAQRVDFSGLPLLKSLTRFKFAAVEEMFFRASAEQCACLARCDALTSLDCGRWDAPAAGSVDELGRPFAIESEESFLAQRIGVLAASKGRTLFEEAAVAASATDQEPRQVRVHALTYLQLKRERVTSLLWSHLSQLTALRELLPRGWSDAISAAEFSKLSSFTQLQRLAIGNPALLLDRVWPPLLSCTSLTDVIICDLYLPADKLQSLLDSLSKLTMLQSLFAAVPSLAPLHNSALTRLTLCSLVDAHGRPVCVRRMLAGVALPRLEHLIILDHDDTRLLPADAAELNRPIFANCPLLLPSNFKQNLR